MKEYDLHLSVVAFLRLALAGNSCFFHIPNGGKRSLTEGKRFKAMGVLAGMPDLAVINDGRVIFLELKAEKGRVSPGQIECHSALLRARSPVAVCRSLDDVIAALIAAGVPLRARLEAA